MALGALMGAGIFVGTIVAGLVVLAAEGVLCRDTLMRDVVAYMLAMRVGKFRADALSSDPATCLRSTLTLLCLVERII